MIENAFDYASQLPAPRHHRLGQSMSVAKALELIPDHSRVYVTPFSGVPTELIDAMAERRHQWTHIEAVFDYLLHPLAIFEQPGDVFKYTTLQVTRAVKGLVDHDDQAGHGAERVLRVIPAALSQFAKLLSPGGFVAPDVALVQVSLPGPGGRFSLGVCGGTTAEVVRSAPIVIAEVNPAMPYTRGVTECDRHDFDALVEVEHPLPELVAAQRSEVATQIGAHVAGLIGDAITLEYGIGAIPDAVLSSLGDRSDLGLHSGMLGDGVIDLIESGVMNGRLKSVDAGFHVAAVLAGSQRLFDWVDGRQDVIMVASGYSHGAGALCRQRRFTALNSAVEVSLDGSVNAEMVGDRLVSGPGGQPDFALGAELADDGMAIVALPSTAGRNRVSRIVSSIAPGRPTTVPRHLADRFVTEHGVASIKGNDLASRAEKLVSIADEAHRGDLL